MDDRFTIDLASTPRHVPLLVRFNIVFARALAQIGWGVFGFGMVFFWIFACNTDPMSLVDFAGELDKTDGRVTSAQATNVSVNKRKVTRYEYTFTTGDGGMHTGASYSSLHSYGAGSKAQVEYPKGEPQRSRIVGMRTALMPLPALLVLIAPAIGGLLIGIGAVKSFKGLRLLRHGHVGRGVLVSKAGTGTIINNKSVYAMTFLFTADDGRKHQTVARSHEVERFQDEAEEPLLYDPWNPSYAILMDELPGAPRIGDDGEIVATHPVRTLLSLIIPLAATLGHGSYFYVKYLA